MASQVNGYIGKLNPGNGTEYSLGSTAYGECSTAANTPAKTVEMTGFTLIKGATIFVKFTNTNSASNPTLSVNSTTAKPLVKYGSSTINWSAGAVLCLTYDGTSWVGTSVTLQDLGLSNAMHFIGKATVSVSDGGTENPTITGYDFTNDRKPGDVIIGKDDGREYVWTIAGQWELLGHDASETYDSGTASGKWITRVQQNSNREVTATLSSETIGSSTQPIWADNGVLKSTTYALKATVNDATQYGVAYYSTTTNLTSTAAGAANTALMGKGSAAPAFVSVSPSSAWTAGTTSGPSLKITVLGVTQTTGAVIPSAGAGASGVVTTGAQQFDGNKTFKGNILPQATNTYTLGASSTGRWKALYIGTADSYGSTTQPIYWNNGVPTATSYSLNATVNSGAANQVAYYSSANAISSKAPEWKAWVAGTTAGPQAKIQIGNAEYTSAAIPSASNYASGIVTTTTQTFAGSKTFNGDSFTVQADTIRIRNKNNNNSQSASNPWITSLHIGDSEYITLNEYKDDHLAIRGSSILLGTTTIQAYNSSATYTAGSVVWYNNTYYTCPEAITTAEEWNAEHWTAMPASSIMAGANFNPWKTNAYSLGTSAYRWSKLYIGTADTYGSNTQPIYWNAGVPLALTYTANRLYYSASTTSFTYTGHYASSDKIAINSTSAPTDTFYVNGNSTFKGNVSPQANNAYDLGTSSLTWKNLYVRNIIFDSADSSTEANRIVWTDSNKKLVANNHYADATHIAINTETAPAENFYVNGTSRFALGTSDEASDKRFLIGSSGRSYLSFGGKSLQAYNNSDAASILHLNQHGGAVTINYSVTDSNADSQLLVKGRVVVDPSYHNRNNFSEFRINRSTAGWSAITLGGAQDTTYGAGLGVWLIGNKNTPNDATTAAASITDSQFYISYNGSASAACRIQGHNADGFSIRPRLAVNADVNTDYNLYVNGTVLIHRDTTTAADLPTGINFSVKDTTTNKTYSSGGILAYHDHHASNTYGVNMVIKSGGAMIIGGGEGPASLYTELHNWAVENSNGNLNTESSYFVTDGTTYIYSNANTIANRIGIALSTGGNILPFKAEAANSLQQTIGASNAQWKTTYTSQLRMMRSSNTESGRIYWYSDAAKTTWVTYMGNADAGTCPTGGKPSTPETVTGWGIRSLITAGATTGWVWESTTTASTEDTTLQPTALFSINGANGRGWFNTSCAASNYQAPCLKVTQSTSIASGADAHLLHLLAPNVQAGGNAAMCIGKALSTDNAGTISFIPGSSAAENVFSFGFVNRGSLLKIYPSGKVHIPYKVGYASADANYTLRLGTDSTVHLDCGFDGIQSQAANNGGGSTLYLNYNGGNVNIGKSNGNATGLYVYGGGEFNDQLNIKRTTTSAANYGAIIRFYVTDTDTNNTQNGGWIACYHDHAASTSGFNMVIRGAGNMFFGAGESPSTLYNTLKPAADAASQQYTGETLYITADSAAYIYANANTVANRVGLLINTSGQLLPVKAEAKNSGVQDIGKSDNKWRYIYGTQVYGAVYNDYAEFRKTMEVVEAGRCIKENGDDSLVLTTQRLERGCEIVSDTYGFAIGESEEAKTPIASSGRVLAYPYESREEFASHIGWPVCSGPNGTVSIMTEEEEEKYPSRIIGTISAVPDYEEWGEDHTKVNGRVWIRIR